MKHIENKAEIMAVDGVRALKGPPDDWQPSKPGEAMPLETKSLAEILKGVIYTTPCETIHDSEVGRKVIQALGTSNGMIDLEDADYSWLSNVLERQLPKLWMVNAIQIMEAFKEGGHIESRAERRAKK